MPNSQTLSNISFRLRNIPEGIGITVVDHADAKLYGDGSLYWEVTRERLWAGGLRSGVPAMTGLAAPSRPDLGGTVARALKAAGLGGIEDIFEYPGNLEAYTEEGDAEVAARVLKSLGYVAVLGEDACSDSEPRRVAPTRPTDEANDSNSPTSAHDRMIARMKVSLRNPHISDSLAGDYAAIIAGEMGLNPAQIEAKRRAERLETQRRNKHTIPVHIDVINGNITVRADGGSDRPEAPFLLSDLHKAAGGKGAGAVITEDDWFESDYDVDAVADTSIPKEQWPTTLREGLLGLGYTTVRITES
jgi:hypothetical protein